RSRRRDSRGDRHLPARQERRWRAPRAARGPAGGKACPRLPCRCLQLSAVSAAGADLSILAGQSRFGAVRRESRVLCRGHCTWHPSGHVRLRLRGRRTRQRHRGPAGRLSIVSQCRPRRLPPCVPYECCCHAAAARRTRRARRAGPDPRGGKTIARPLASDPSRALEHRRRLPSIPATLVTDDDLRSLGMAELLKPDICVIGAGAGGLSVAAAPPAFGVSVVLVEKDRMGGDCLNTGCVPSKSLIAAAKHARAIAQAGSFGLSAPPPDIDFAAVHKHVHEIITAIAPNDAKQRFTGLGVKVIEGSARFKNRRTVTVGEELEIRARRFVIASGSSPSVPAIPGLEATPYLTNETVFDLTTRPEHLVIIGAGPVGLELAQAFRRLGAAVTVLEAQAP